MTNCTNCERLRQERDDWQKIANESLDKYAEVTRELSLLRSQLDAEAFMRGVRDGMERKFGLTEARNDGSLRVGASERRSECQA